MVSFDRWSTKQNPQVCSQSLNPLLFLFYLSSSFIAQNSLVQTQCLPPCPSHSGPDGWSQTNGEPVPRSEFIQYLENMCQLRALSQVDVISHHIELTAWIRGWHGHSALATSPLASSMSWICQAHSCLSTFALFLEYVYPDIFMAYSPDSFELMIKCSLTRMPFRTTSSKITFPPLFPCLPCFIFLYST